MEDDKMKDLFNGFDPILASDGQFMANLQRNMEAIEFVKRQNLAFKRRSKIAVLIAAFCGFAMGIICSYLFPLAGDWISTVSVPIPGIDIRTPVVDYKFMSWILLSVVSGLTALNAYEIALAKLPLFRTFDVNL